MGEKILIFIEENESLRYSSGPEVVGNSFNSYGNKEILKKQKTNSREIRKIGGNFAGKKLFGWLLTH